MRRMAETAWMLVIVLLVLPGFPSLAQEETPPLKTLERELGDHSGAITSLAVDAASTTLVTGSTDGTVRIWDATTYELLHTLRMPDGYDETGKHRQVPVISHVAISPDGAWIAAGVTHGVIRHIYLSDQVYIIDRERGSIQLALNRDEQYNKVKPSDPDGLSQCQVDGLTFARESPLLMVSCMRSSNSLLSIFDAERGTRVVDSKPMKHQFLGMDIDQLGRLLVLTRGGLEVFDARFNPIMNIHLQGGKQPVSFAITPDGKRFAIAYGDTGRIDILDTQTFSRVSRVAMPGTTSRFAWKLLAEPRWKTFAGYDGDLVRTVRWSPDSTTLYALGYDGQISRWANGGQAAREVFAQVSAPVSAFQCLALDRVVMGTARGWSVLGLGAKLLRATSPELLRIDGALELDLRGHSVRFQYGPSPEEVAVFSVADRSLRVRTGAEAGFSPPSQAGSGLVIHREEHGVRLKRDWGEILNSGLPSESGRLRCGVITQDGGAILGGKEGMWFFPSSAFRESGFVKPPRPPRRLHTGVTSVNISPDGTLVVAALEDGSIRWYRASDLEELLALVIHPDLKRWLLWTPSGYYDASVGAEEFVGWRVGRGAGESPDFFSLSQFRDELHRPRIIAEVLPSLDEAQAVLKSSGSSFSPKSASNLGLPPVVTILKPGARITSADQTLTLELIARAPIEGTIDGFRVLVNGRPLPSANVSIQPSRPNKAPGGGLSDQNLHTVRLPLPISSCSVAVQARTGERWSELAVVQVDRPEKSSPGSSSGFEINPKLYVLSVGVSAYKEPKLQLEYAAKDARDFASVLKLQEGKLYRKVEVKTLIDAQASANNIRDGLEWLERQTTQHDVAVLFIAGHGMNDTSGQYHFMPYEADPTAIKRTMVPDSDIQKTLAVLAGKVLFFFDTCHSGNMLGTTRRGAALDTATDAFTNELISAETGAIVFASSSGGQVSQESQKWGNGAFTKALVEALGGRADFNKTGRITVKMLDLYVSERVKELTSGTQTPTTGVPAMVRDFPVAVVE